MSQTLHRIIRRPEMRELTGLSNSTIDRLEEKDEIPPRVQLTSGGVGWWKDEVLERLENRPRGPGRSTAAATAAKQAKLRQARLGLEAGADAPRGRKRRIEPLPDASPASLPGETA